MNAKSAAVMDTGRGDVDTNASREMPIDLSRREESGGRYLSKLTGKLIEEQQQLSAAVTIGGGTYKATIDTGAIASFISKELADDLAALGKITRIRQQVRLADGRCDDESMNSWRWKSHSGTSDHELADTTRGIAFIGVGMELSNTSRNRDKLCWTRNNNTSQESTQWMD